MTDKQIDMSEHSIEVRMALMEDFKVRTLEHHRQTMEKLDNVLKILSEKQCTLHAARMLQFDQDLTAVRNDIKELKQDLKEIQLRLAVWSGAAATIAFIAGKLF